MKARYTLENRQIRFDDIRAEPEDNIRSVEAGKSHEDHTSINDLSKSIRRYGLQNPLVVEEIPDAKDDETQYQLVQGFRRHMALSKLLAKTPDALVDVRVRRSKEGEDSDTEFTTLQIVENVQRENLKPWELATALASLRTSGDLSGAEISNKVGLSRGYVLKLLKVHDDLHPKIWEEWAGGKVAVSVNKLERLTQMSLDDQWQKWTTGGDGEEEKQEGKKGKKGKKLKLPTQKKRELMLTDARLVARDRQEDEYLRGVIAALSWVCEPNQTPPVITAEGEDE